MSTKPINHGIVQSHSNPLINAFIQNSLSPIDPAMIARLEWITQFVSGKIFLKKIITFTRTHENYLYRLKNFCDFVKKTPDDLYNLWLDGQRLFISTGVQNSVVQDLMAEQIPLMKMVNGDPITESSMHSTQVAICAFFRANGGRLNIAFIVYTPKFKANLNNKFINDLMNTKLPMPQNPKLEQFFQTRNQALIQFMANTGFRPETVSLLKWGDLKPTNDPDAPIVFVVPPEKMKGKRKSQRYTFTWQTSFLSTKAYSYLLKYKSIINPKDTDALFAKRADRQQLNSLSPMGFWQIFDDLCQYNFDNKIWDKRYRFANDSCRHYISEVYNQSNIPQLSILMLTGHAASDVMKFYIRVDPDNPITDCNIQDLMNNFKKAIPKLP